MNWSREEYPLYFYGNNLSDLNIPLILQKVNFDFSNSGTTKMVLSNFDDFKGCRFLASKIAVEMFSSNGPYIVRKWRLKFSIYLKPTNVPFSTLCSWCQGIKLACWSDSQGFFLLSVFWHITINFKKYIFDAFHEIYIFCCNFCTNNSEDRNPNYFMSRKFVYNYYYHLSFYILSTALK